MTAYDPLRIEDATLGKQQAAIARQQWEHEQRLFDIERLLKQVAQDTTEIKRSVAKVERINDALLEMQLHNAKATIAAADLRDEVKYDGN